MSAKLIQEAVAAIQLATKGRSAGDTAAMNVGDLSVILGLLLSSTSHPAKTVWLRDLDGTGSMHVCSQGDPGAVEFVPAYQALENRPVALADATKADALSAKDRDLAEVRAYHKDALQQLAAASDQRDEALSALREKDLDLAGTWKAVLHVFGPEGCSKVGEAFPDGRKYVEDIR